jgi:hypothetical protein
MEYCKYHPILPASYHCKNCETDCCDSCVDEEKLSNGMTCFICNNTLISYGSANTVTPFWRRLDQSFKYPLKLETIILIVGISLLSVFVSYLPFSFIFSILLLAGLVKYCFTCLQFTSDGEMVAPDITESFAGGLKILGYLLLMIIILTTTLSLSSYLIGEVFTRLLAFIIMISIPAMLINYGLSESFLNAVNPVKAFKLVSSIGLPYGLLLAFIMIMFASISVIQQLIGSNYSNISFILQSSVSNYYMIVIFHIMGYMIFQFQKELGFVATENYGNEKGIRSKQEWLTAKIDVHLKEGKYDKVLELFKWSLRGFSNPDSFKNYFDFLLATNNAKEIEDFAPKYFEYLVKSNRKDKFTFAYKKILTLIPEFKPASEPLRFDIAQACYEGRDPRNTVKLINGVHKEFPNSARLSEFYELMALALDEIPNMESKSDQSRKLASHFKSKNQ